MSGYIFRFSFNRYLTQIQENFSNWIYNLGTYCWTSIPYHICSIKISYVDIYIHTYYIWRYILTLEMNNPSSEYV